jgi:hypothetical protein
VDLNNQSDREEQIIIIRHVIKVKNNCNFMINLYSLFLTLFLILLFLSTAAPLPTQPPNPRPTTNRPTPYPTPHPTYKKRKFCNVNESYGI